MTNQSVSLARIPLEAAAALSGDDRAEVPLYLPDQNGPVLYRQSNCGLSAPDLDRLRSAGHSHLLVNSEHLSRCETALETKLSEIVRDTRLGPEQRATCVQSVGAMVARDLLAVETPSTQMPRAVALVDSVVESVLGDPAVAANLLRVSAHDKSTASHMFSVSFFGALLGYSTFGAERPTLQEIGLAGMLHDLGKTSIPPAILHKKSPLTPDELRVIHHHPIESVRLIGDDLSVNSRVRQMILQHHERLDGTGYPLGLVDSELLVGSKILSIVDTFHAMIGRRSYQKARKPSEAMKLMRYHVNTQFDARLFENWCRIFGRYCKSAAQTEGPPEAEDTVAPAFHHDHKAVQSGIQNRKSDRLTCQGAISVRCVYAGRLDRATEAMSQYDLVLKDLSRSGLCMSGRHPMYRGEMVHLRISSEGKTVWVQAMVRWCRKDHHEDCYRIGVKFLHRIEEGQVGQPAEVAGMDNEWLFPELGQN